MADLPPLGEVCYRHRGNRRRAAAGPSRRLPEMVGAALRGVFGPHVLGFFGEDRPIAHFFAELGKLLLMFSAGLEVDVDLFRKAQTRSIIFGLITTTVPLLLGTLFGLAFGYAIIPAIVVGSLLASHTLLGLSIMRRLGVIRLEPVIVTIGATVAVGHAIVDRIRDLRPDLRGWLLAHRARHPAHRDRRLRPSHPLRAQSRGRLCVEQGAEQRGRRIRPDARHHGGGRELADFINLPGIVGAFLAGLAVNAAVRERAAKTKLDFFGKALFIPCFFVATGFLIDPIAFAQSVLDSLPLVAGIIATLVLGKWIAATVVGRAFGYTPAARMTIWALTLPQVAATLAATLVAYHTVNSNGQRMLDERMLNAVLVLMLATSILGPVLTERFAPRMLDAEARQRDGAG